MTQGRTTFRHAQAPLTGDRLFAWSLGAPYHASEMIPVDGLDASNRAGSWRPFGLITRRLSRIGLSRAWGIRGRDDLIEAMEHLGAEGHRLRNRAALDRLFAQQRHRGAGAQVPRMEPEVEAMEQRSWLRDAVDRDEPGLRDAPLLAFDAARGVMLARDGLVHRWLGDEEAWGYLLDLASEVAGTFDGWDAYGRDFILGRNAWAADDLSNSFSDTVGDLLDDEASPWRQVPWGMSGAPPSVTSPRWYQA